MKYSLGQIVEFYRCCCDECCTQSPDIAHDSACYRADGGLFPRLPVVGKIVRFMPFDSEEVDPYILIEREPGMELDWGLSRNEVRPVTFEDMTPAVPPIDYRKYHGI